MVCEHLAELEAEIVAAGIKETLRGRAWSKNSREWIYFDCYLPATTIRNMFGLAECVIDHQHKGTHNGQESGFVCSIHKNGIMGHHPESAVLAETFKPTG